MNREGAALLEEDNPGMMEEYNAAGMEAREMGYDPNPYPVAVAPGSDGTDGAFSAGPGERVTNYRDGGLVSIVHDAYYQEGGEVDPNRQRLGRFIADAAYSGDQQRQQVLAALPGSQFQPQENKILAGAVEDAYAQPEAEEADETAERTVEIIDRAMQLTDAAATAGDIVNGHVDPDDETAAELKAAEEEQSGLISSLIRVGGAYSEGLRNVREEILTKYAARIVPDSYRAYVRLKGLANQMVFPILESGALGVNPTDADVELARQAQFDISAPSNTWNAQLAGLRARTLGDPEPAGSYYPSRSWRKR